MDTHGRPASLERALEGCDDLEVLRRCMQHQHVLAEFEEVWSVQYQSVLEVSATASTVRGRAPGQQVAARLPHRPVLGRWEAAAYKTWRSHDLAPRVFDIHAKSGILLLEHLLAAPTPVGVDPRVPAAALKELHQAGTYGFGEARGGDLPLLAEALELRRELALGGVEETERQADAYKRGLELAASYRGRRVLLHGDYTPWNLFWNGKKAWVVNPIPAVGDPAYDAATWVLVTPQSKTIAAEAFAKALSVEKARILSWVSVLREFQLVEPRSLQPKVTIQAVA